MPALTLQRTLFILLAFVLSATSVHATEPERPIRINQENLAKLSIADQDRVLCIAERLETITTMDRSSLNRAERKVLRAETRDLNREAQAFNRNGTVLYISATTIIIILLIIIILT